MLKQNQPSVAGDTQGSLPVISGVAFEVPFHLNTNLSKQLEEKFPGFKFVESQFSSGVSLHPFLHCERLVKEHVALSMCEGLVVDVGGNPQRHRKLGRSNVWSMCPIITAADKHRHEKFASSGAFMYCDHKFGQVAECACAHPGTWLSVDSLYYLDRQELCRALQKADMVAVIHDFSQPEGNYYGEGKYVVGADGNVSMVVKGSSIAYEHSALGWMRYASCYWDSELDIGMTWYLVKSVGSSLIYRFCHIDQPVKSDPTPLSLSLTDPTVYAESMEVESNCCGTLGGVSLKRLAPWGGSVVVATESYRYVVPKRLVAHARMACLLQPRTPDTFQLVVRKVKEFVTRENTVPYVDRPECIILASTLGFVADLEFEQAAVHEMLSRIEDESEYHSSLLSFEKKDVWYTATLLMWFLWPIKKIVAAPYTAIVASIQGRDNSSLVMKGAVNNLVLPAYHAQRASKMPVLGASFVFSYQWKKIRTKGAQLCGLAIAQYLPVVSADTPENEERAIIHRALIPPLPSNAHAWEQVEETLHELLPPKVIRPTQFEIWNARFSKTRQKNQRLALENFMACPDIEAVKRSCIRKTFIKREKLLKSDPGGIEDYDPRVIQGVGDLANALLGPYIHAFSKYLSSKWRKDKPVTYAAGLNAEGLGEWLDLCICEGYTWYLESDYSRYDVSIPVAGLAAEQSIYKTHGVGKWAQAVLQEQMFVRGVSSHGHKYSIKGTRCSGDPNTSCGNSMLNAGVVVTVLKQLGITDYKLIVMGDDMVVALREYVDPDMYALAVASYGLSAKAKITDDPDLVEFCSGRFWTTKAGRVWGPKVGRFMAKIGFSVPVQHDPHAWMKGVLVGVRQDVAHVPLLNVYVEHCLGLLAQVKGKARVDDHRFHVGSLHKATPDTYQQFYKVYDLTPLDLDTLKSTILSVKSLPAVIDHPLFEAMVQRDLD